MNQFELRKTAAPESNATLRRIGDAEYVFSGVVGGEHIASRYALVTVRGESVVRLHDCFVDAVVVVMVESRVKIEFLMRVRKKKRRVS